MPIEYLLLAGIVAVALLLVLVLRRPQQAPQPGGEMLALLAGKVETLAGLQTRQADSTGDLAERLSSTLLDHSKALGEALRQQNERLAGQEQRLADRMAATEKAMAEAMAAQNARLNTVLGDQTDRVAKQLADQAQATQQTATAIQERLAVIDAARTNMEALGAQVTTLTGILGNKQQRGAFGEVQLEQIIKDRLPPDGFALQHTLGNGRRCDCLIRLPHPPGPIVVDSKFPLEAWAALRDAVDDATRNAALRQFAGDVTKHVRDVADRYILPGETAEGALIFVPSEAIFAELHAMHPGVVAEAAKRGVYVVSPTTLWAVLGTMRALMRDVRIRAEAGRIKDEVGKLVGDVRRLDERVGKLKTHFDQAQKDIRDIEISTEKIVRTGGRIETVELEPAPPPSPALAAGPLA